MQFGYFKSELVDNIEQNECSPNWNKLLSKNNMSAFWALSLQGSGYYETIVADEMAFASMLVTTVFDDDGRPFTQVSAAITKFDANDREEILSLLNTRYGVKEKMKATLNDGGKYTNL